jgi:lipopolysaccharide export system permease protein
MKELHKDVDSITTVIKTEQISIYGSTSNMYYYHFKNDSIKWPDDIKQLKRKRDSIALVKKSSDSNSPTVISSTSDKVIETEAKTADTTTLEKYSIASDSIYQPAYTATEIASALNQVRMVKAQLLAHNANIKSYEADRRVFTIQWHKILAQAIACIAMFLIGAPLGAIIKKGGLGVPVLMSILFFILFYVLSLMGEKWAKQEVLSIPMGMWLANLVLVLIGALFLKQARADARLFDSDFYSVIFDRLKRKFLKAA